jgi:hypothetical protein
MLILRRQLMYRLCLALIVTSMVRLLLIELLQILEVILLG